MVINTAYVATMVGSVALRDSQRFGSSIQDMIVEPARAHLIPGFTDVKAAALKHGALGASISGSGSSVFAVTNRKTYTRSIGQAMQKIFLQHGIYSKATIVRIDKQGARPVRSIKW